MMRESLKKLEVLNQIKLTDAQKEDVLSFFAKREEDVRMLDEIDTSDVEAMVHVAPIDPADIPTGDGPGAGWGEDIIVDSDILDFDNDSGSGTLDNSAWS